MPVSTAEWIHPLSSDGEPVPMLIDGQWVRDTTTATIAVFDPGTGAAIAEVAAGGRSHAGPSR